MGAKNAEDAEGPLRFTVFGAIGAWRGEEQLDLGSARQRAVLAVLLLHANRPVGRERLIEAVWGAPSPAYAVNQLQKYVSALRRILEPGRTARSPSKVLVWSEGGYILWVARDSLDLSVFEHRVSRGREAFAEGDAQQAATELADALALWSGPALENVSSAVLDVERDRLAELRTAVLEERIDTDLHLGRHGRLIPELTQLVAEFPLRERFASLLMLALFRAGRQAEALAVYDTARGVLAEELGIDPGPELQQRHRQILTSDAALTLDGADATEHRGQGRHRVPASCRPDSAEDLALRLDDARKMQIKAGDEARTAYALVFRLLGMVNSLQERVQHLEAEKRLHAPGPELQQELTASHERLAKARRQLAQARRERERAEEIQLATQRLVGERLHEREPGPQSQLGEGDAGHDRFTSAEEFGLAPLYEVDHLLEASEMQLKEQAGQLDELSGMLDLTRPAEEVDTDDDVRVVRGELVNGPPAGATALPDPPEAAGSPSARSDGPVERDAGDDGTAPAAKPLQARKSEVSGRLTWLPGGLLAGAAAFLLVYSSTVYESRNVKLDYDMSNPPARISSSATALRPLLPPSPQYTQMGNQDLWSVYTPDERSPAITFERHLKAKLILSAPEDAGPHCSEPLSIGTGWTLSINGETEIKSGTLSANAGDTTTIDSALPADPETITLTASANSACEFKLEFRKPTIHYKGLWVW
ncbi:AfsR/SARP family transcriptional regulator [Streptomyces sp. WMMB 322]|uniref:AfsR/SARP family transcriptional regulator n=1 Tax=Streptomyces sp. WMMB 322 TaxID=1286821 RepID=UPI000823C215|nr:AfsR/SARP family transcriptional regulator [Streptomyces sp. WMMB 322]SCK55124.1 DNA-binding transcriptional activator of the SARP family [Streptomyces sp. WMMB 322]